ncbi:class I SAM-dependent methyltransferase [Nocardia transvalensis]|uniref:class I SAM-dependent methyltransferase n=1 Tax=Nocardia transvalensis TaxID=37333 RepID=UPI001894881B|nr:class I SAM-dependent methyltransferase [Nocardia transvalensis]MBF6332820.1 class I SAM-dependent methyltransferase [Nocardia transvalensis]
MTEHHPHSITRTMGNRHDYLPATGHDLLLPGYDLMTRLLGMPAVYDTLLAQAGLADGHRVLEIGCGTGNLTLRAKRSRPAAEVIGTDPDPRALARAQRKARGVSGIRFERVYAQQLPYGDAEFDRVLSSMMLHHLDPEAKAQAAAEVLRVLRPGGRLHVVDIGGAVGPEDGWSGRRLRHNRHAVGNLGEAIPRLLRETGFDCTEVASQRKRFIGRVTYYQAVRPA